MIKVPRLSKPDELVEVVYIDLGDEYRKHGYTSRFEFEGVVVENFVQKTETNNVAKYRYSQDCAFLEKHDLCLAQAEYGDD